MPLNVENINKGVPDSELQRDHFQGRVDITKERASNDDDNNDEDDYVSLVLTNSISIHSTNTTNDSTSSNNNMNIDILSTQDDDAVSTTSKASEQTPKELQSTFDSEYWSCVDLHIDDTTPDFAVNLDRFYWGNNNTIGEDTSIVLSAIIQYSPMEPSYVLAAMYQVETSITEQQQHASKATPQYGFHKGMKEFADKERKATKQEIHKNLLGMDAVIMIKPDNLEKKLCINALTYLMFLKQ